MNEIGIWFLLLSLFFPRIVLFFWWMTGNLPFNTTPFIADVFGAIIVPRILILIYIYQNQAMSPWFWIHLVAMGCLIFLRIVRMPVYPAKINSR